MYYISPGHWTFSDARGFDPDKFGEQCVRRVNENVVCSRTGLWCLMTGMAVVCCAVWASTTQLKTVVQAPPETERAASHYFATLMREGRVVAYLARTHPATRSFFEHNLLRSGVQSLLACAFCLNDALFGAFTCTQTDRPVAWPLGSWWCSPKSAGMRRWL